MTTETVHAGCDLQHYSRYFPFGRPLYRSRWASDYACLLDRDACVLSWRSVVDPLVEECPDLCPRRHQVDFEVETGSERRLVDIGERRVDVGPWVGAVAKRQGFSFQPISRSEFAAKPRLQNAKDLFRYAGWKAALGDRIRTVAGLAEFGSLTLAECLSAVRDDRPMRSVAAMLPMGIIDLDLDNPLGPDSVARLATDRGPR